MWLFRNRVVQVICLITFVLYTFSATRSSTVVVVSGDSMLPTYSDGDYLVVEEPTMENLESGFPVCWVRLDDGTDVIKRLVGLPGQTVELIDGTTFVNGKHIMDAVGDSVEDAVFVLEENQYLFLGDNRPNSVDGRFWYPSYVGIENIKGVVPDSGLGGDAFE